jgi:hypothetical protein
MNKDTSEFRQRSFDDFMRHHPTVMFPGEIKYEES